MFRKILVVASLFSAMLSAQATPADDIVAAIKADIARTAPADKVQSQMAGQTVLRGIAETTNGPIVISTASNTYFGYLIPKAVLTSAVLGLGFRAIPTLSPMDIFVGLPGTTYANYNLLVYSDQAGNASDLILMNNRFLAE